MIAIITYTPIWVWAVLALLIYLGILQRKNAPFKGDVYSSCLPYSCL